MMMVRAVKVILATVLLILGSVPVHGQATATGDSLRNWYLQQYPFISIEDTVFTFETEFIIPEGYSRPDSSEWTPFQNWVARFPLWHQWKAVGVWKGGKAFENEEISRVVHIPWKGRVYTEVGFPLRIMAEFLRKENREYDFRVIPHLGDTLDYKTFLSSKVARSGRGEVVLVPAAERDSSAFEYYRFLNACMQNQDYASLAANCDSITLEEAAPGDLLIGHDERGRTGSVFMVMNVLVNGDGEKLYTVARGCPEACDFHIPLLTLKRDFPWVTADQLKALVDDLPTWGGFRPVVPNAIQ